MSLRTVNNRGAKIRLKSSRMSLYTVQSSKIIYYTVSKKGSSFVCVVFWSAQHVQILANSLKTQELNCRSQSQR